MTEIDAMRWRVGTFSGSSLSVVGEGEDGLRITWKWRFARPRNWTRFRREMRNKRLAEKVVAWIEQHGLQALRAPENEGLIERLAGELEQP